MLNSTDFPLVEEFYLRRDYTEEEKAFFSDVPLKFKAYIPFEILVALFYDNLLPGEFSFVKNGELFLWKVTEKGFKADQPDDVVPTITFHWAPNPWMCYLKILEPIFFDVELTNPSDVLELQEIMTMIDFSIELVIAWHNTSYDFTGPSIIRELF